MPESNRSLRFPVQRTPALDAPPPNTRPRGNSQMPPELQAVLIVAASGTTLLVIFFALIYYLDRPIPSTTGTAWALTQPCHRAPRIRYTAPQAHAVMQDLLMCSVADCPRKAAAFTVLVESGKITASTRASGDLIDREYRLRWSSWA